MSAWSAHTTDSPLLAGLLIALLSATTSCVDTSRSSTTPDVPSASAPGGAADGNPSSIADATTSGPGGQDTSAAGPEADGAEAGTGNRPPSVLDVQILPGAPRVGDTLTCTWSGYSDPDGDADASLVTWRVGDTVVVGDGVQLSSGFTGSDAVTCTVTPFDGTLAGEPASATVVIENTPPTLASATISPAHPGVSDRVTCTWQGWADVDGALPLVAIAWEVDGEVVGEDADLELGPYARGDEVTCRVTPLDGVEAGVPVSSSVVIENTPPTVASVTITPAAPSAGDTLTCGYEGFEDPDGDADGSEVQWRRGQETLGTGSTLSTGFARGDEITCAVSPRDGLAVGPAVQASVVIGNAPPTALGASISPPEPTVGSPVGCHPAGFHDPDGDADQSTVAWQIDGAPAGTAATLVAPQRGATIHCALTPSDGDASGPTVHTEVTVVNAAPHASGVAIVPEVPLVGQPVTCAVLGFADADGDDDATTYAWYLGSQLLGVEPTLSAAPPRGSELTCRATPKDGLEEGSPVEATVVVGNSAPELASTSIEPSTPTVSAPPTCVAAGFADPDGDEEMVSYAWRVNGDPAGQGATLVSGFVRGDGLECEATPFDGLVKGAAVVASAVVGNAAPTLADAVLSPKAPVTDDNVECEALGFLDPDGDANASTVEWLVGTELVGTGPTLPVPAFRGDEVTCRAVPFDGQDEGPPVSRTVTVANAPPSASHATIKPAAPAAGEVLTCQLHGFSDPEGDADASTFEWLVDGTPAGDGPVLEATPEAGQVVTCLATPSDGSDAGAVEVAEAVVVNSSPTLAAAVITPAPPHVGDIVTCTGVGWDDADGDADESTVAWFVNGTPAGDEPEPGVLFAHGDLLRCEVTPWDGSAAGPTVAAEVVVANTPGSLSGASISPEQPAATSLISCTGEGWDDADGDEELSITSWFVNDTPAGQGPVLAASVTAGDIVRCEVTPFDGLDGGAVVMDQATVQNTPPTASAATISPAAPKAGDVLTCDLVDYDDVDGQPAQSIFSWKVNGAPAGTGPTLEAPLVHGDVVVCTVTLWDGWDEGGKRAAQVTVGNTAPSAAGAILSTTAPTTGQSLSCSVEGFEDPDGEADASVIEWLIAGEVVATGGTLPAAPARGTGVTCRITPFDGLMEGPPVFATALVANSVPTITGVVLDPAVVHAGDHPLCRSAGWSDADSDLEQSKVTWTVNDGPELQGSVLSVSVVHGDSLHCQVQPFDGLDDGLAAGVTVTVSNTPPTITGAVLEPASPVVGQPVTCAGTGYLDADGEADQSTVSWLVVDATFDGAELAAEHFDFGDSLLCIVTPFDGTDTGAPAVKAVVVGNTPPSIASVELSPASVKANEPLACSWSGFFDLEGAADQSVAQWFINGQPAGSGPGLDSGYVAGDVVTCRVVPSDGLSDGDPVSAQVTVDNTPPALGSASITPTTVRAGTQVSCGWDGFEDPDGQPDQTTVAWTLNSAPAAEGVFWTGPYTRGDVIGCVATAFDGVESGETASALVIVANTAPTVAGAAIDPPAPRDDDEIGCAVVGYADADGDPDQSQIAWSVNGQPAGSGPTLSGGFAGGDTVACTVTAHDGYGAGNHASIQVVVAATAPTIDAVQITPAAATVEDELTCSWQGFASIDGGPDQSEVRWYVNGTLVGSDVTLDAGFARGDEVSCSVTPDDGVYTGAASNAVITIGNARPRVTSVWLTPAQPRTSDLVTASAEVFDADGDDVSLAWAWEVNGSPALCVGATCSGTVAFHKGQSITVTATPSDGLDQGVAVESDAVVVANSAPSPPALGFSEPVANPDGTDIDCVITGAAVDPDLDPLTITYSWLVDGAGAPVAGPTVPAALTVPGETWTCVAHTTDGEASAPDASASIIIGNGWTADIVTKTQWALEGSPYVLGSDVEIGGEGELEVTEGVEIFGQGHAIVVATLLKLGNGDTNKPPVIVRDLTVRPAEDGSLTVLEIKNVEWTGGSLLAAGVSGPIEKLTLHDSILVDLEGAIAIDRPEKECQVYRNLFVRTGGLRVDPLGTIKIHHNAWIEQTTPAVEKWGGLEDKVDLVGNSFLSTDRIAVALPVGATGEGLVADDNYWGTTSWDLVDTMVFDDADDPAAPASVTVDTLLSEPDDAAPDPSGLLP